MYISWVQLIIQSRTCIFHASSSNRWSSFTMFWPIMCTGASCHYDSCLNMASWLIKWVWSRSWLWNHSMCPLCARIRQMICAGPLRWSWVRLAMKTHPLSTGSHHLMAPINLAHMILAATTCINRAVILAHILLLLLPPTKIILNSFLTDWSAHYC